MANPSDFEKIKKHDGILAPVEMTPELKTKAIELSYKIVDLLRKETKGPLEAYMILWFVMQSFKKNYGFEDAVVINEGEAKE